MKRAAGSDSCSLCALRREPPHDWHASGAPPSMPSSASAEVRNRVGGFRLRADVLFGAGHHFEKLKATLNALLLFRRERNVAVILFAL